ncbi:hypothetical protein Tco_0824648 [Tanacetum coccineum]|uniref:Uncharacterized protein n=1 Tax=Tanacetum coccineum TaxID=301880 RepID=A0ABQ5AQZ8_9ASTR
MSVRQLWKRKTSTPKPSSYFQNESPPLPPQVHHQSPSPPSYNPLRDEMINSLHNISTILDTHNNPSNAYSQTPPSPPPQQIYPPSHGQAIKDRVDILLLLIGPDTPPKKTLTMLSMFDIFMLFARVVACDTDRTYPGSLVLGNGQRISGIGLSGPTFGNTLLRYKLVLGKDAILANGNFSRTPEYVEECQHPEELDPVIVQRSVVICTFSSGFLKGSSNPTTISNTARTLRSMGFVLIANPMYGDFLTEPLPFSFPGIMIPKTSDLRETNQKR